MTLQANAVAIYREIKRSIPGIDGMYRLVSALVAKHTTDGNRLLIAGAGGGREIEALGASMKTLDVIAIDLSAGNLQTAKQIAATLGLSGRIKFVCGTVDDLPREATFDIATSLLVMQHLSDDGAKLAYLMALKDRLAPNGALILADVCHDGRREIESLMSAYLAHASHIGVADDITRIETDAVSRLPVVSPLRTRELLGEAGFTPPRELFRSLWYRCWVTTRADSGL